MFKSYCGVMVCLLLAVALGCAKPRFSYAGEDPEGALPAVVAPDPRKDLAGLLAPLRQAHRNP